MLASTAQETNLPLPQPTALLEFIMCSQEPVLPYYRVMRTKSVRSNSTLKETRSSLLVVTKLAKFGQLTLEI